MFIPLISNVLHQKLRCAKIYQMQFSEQPGHEHIHFHFVPRAVDIPEDEKGHLYSDIWQTKKSPMFRKPI